MTITGYAHQLASRIPSLAEDCVLNNAVVIDAELSKLFKELTKEKAMVTEIKIKATEQQVKQMEQNCEFTEALMATTLANRIQGMSAEESIPYIRSWFQSVRSMGQANFMMSGIVATVAEK